MSGYALGQGFGYGLTEQSTIIPGAAGAAAPPAAGANYVFTLSRYDRARLVACTFSLTTDSNAANRFVTVEYSGSTTVANMADPTAAVVVASTTALRFFGGLNFGNVSNVANGGQIFPLSGLWIEAGSTVSIKIASVQVGDQLNNIRLTFDRFPGGGSLPAESDVPN
jgi:hypothetical protein